MVAEAFLFDQAKADDRVAYLRGRQPAAEVNLRALLADDVADDGEVEDDGFEGASITDLAGWVERANSLVGGR